MLIILHSCFASVAQAYVNQKKLDTETKILQANAAQFSKQTVQWLKLVEDFNTSLKVAGVVSLGENKLQHILYFFSLGFLLIAPSS